MAVKQKRIIYCDLCRDEVKREQNALRAQAYR